jgi:predicted site-specific integrase-resolvase
MLKLKDWAKQMGVTYQAAWNWFKAGKIPGAYQLPTGMILLPDNVDELFRKLSEDKKNGQRNVN